MFTSSLAVFYIHLQMSVFPMVCQRFHSARRIGVVKVLGSTARPLITCWQPMRVRLLQEMAGDVTAWNIQAPCISKMRREPKLAETIHLSIIVVLGFCGDLAMQKQLKALLVSYITPCWQQLSQLYGSIGILLWRLAVGQLPAWMEIPSIRCQRPCSWPLCKIRF